MKINFVKKRGSRRRPNASSSRTLPLAAAITLCSIACSTGVNSQIISAELFGQNAWVPSFVVENGSPGKFEQMCPRLAPAGVNLVRIGGINYNNCISNSQYETLLVAIESIGAEPMVQIRDNLSAQQVRTLVSALQKDPDGDGTGARDIVYWSIGNEPDHAGKSIELQ